MRHAAFVALLVLLASCSASAPADEPTAGDSAGAERAEPLPEGLRIVAESPRRWTGLAVTEDETVYVSYPRWSADVPVSVARLDPSGEPAPFPDAGWNDWTAGDDPETSWVCVQSVVLDAEGRLWVLDPGNPGFQGVVAGAPKLVRFDLPSAVPAQVIRFAEPTVTDASYLNDVRFDLGRQTAYLTDSGDGALVVVDLAEGTSRRVLDGHPTTVADDITMEIGGVSMNRAVHADGIAVDLAADRVYFQALTSRTLHAIDGAALRDASLDAEALAARVEDVAESGVSDGLWFHEGEVLVSALEHDAIRAVSPEGEIRTLVSDPRIAWPDSFAVPPGGDVVYFTTTQIHLTDPPDPFRIFALRL